MAATAPKKPEQKSDRQVDVPDDDDQRHPDGQDSDVASLIQ